MRQFGPQNGTWTQVMGMRSLSWLELRCPDCRRTTYLQRARRLTRTGSQREYAPCAHCGVRLTLGRVVRYPAERRRVMDMLRFWRRERGRETLEVT